MKKGIIILVIVILIILSTIGLFVNNIINPSLKIAELILEKGSVEVNTGNGYKTITKSIDLPKNAMIRTNDFPALLVLKESIFIDIDPETEVSIEELSKNSAKLKQNSGSTWSKFTALSGINSYSIETPTTVATVRGTEFGVNLNKEKYEIEVGEGNVEVEDTENNEKQTLTEFQSLEKIHGQKAKLIEISKERRKIVLTRMEKSLENMKQMRLKQIRRQKLIFNQVKKKYSVTDADIEKSLSKLDAGEFNQEEILAKVPEELRNLPAVQNLVNLNKKIFEQREKIQEARQKKVENVLNSTEQALNNQEERVRNINTQLTNEN